MPGRRVTGSVRAAALLAFLACSAAIAPAAFAAAPLAPFTLALDGPVAASHAPYLHGVTPVALYAAMAFVISRNKKKEEEGK